MNHPYNNAIVNRCVSIISQFASSIKIKIYLDGKNVSKEDVLYHVLYENKRYSFYEIIESFYTDYILFGNSYLSLDFNSKKELYLSHIPQYSIKPIYDNNHLMCYDVDCGKYVKRFHIKDNLSFIFHYKKVDPMNSSLGFSPLESAQRAINIYNKGSLWTESLLNNSARPSGAIICNNSQGLSEEQYMRLKDQLNSSYKGEKNAGKVMVLEGDLDWKSMSLTASDMDFTEARRDASREIALAFSVPSMLLGIPGDNTYSNFREAKDAFMQYTIYPMVYKVSRSFERWVNSLFCKNYSLECYIDNNFYAEDIYPHPPKVAEKKNKSFKIYT